MIPIVNSGELNKKLSLQAPTVTRDTDGAEIITWATLTTVWGSINPISGKEYWQAQQVNSELTHNIKIRYRSGLNTKMRFLYGNRIFNILTIVNPTEKNVEFICKCKEVV